MSRPILIELWREEDPIINNGVAKDYELLPSGLTAPKKFCRRVMVDATRIVSVSQVYQPDQCCEIRMTAGGSQFVNNDFDEVVAAWASATQAMAIEMTRLNPNGHDGEDLDGRGPHDSTAAPAGSDPDHPLPEDLS